MNKGVSITVKDILRLAVPAIIAGIAEPLISLTDAAMVGDMRSNGVVGLLAVGMVGSFLSAITWTLAQTKTSISSIVSKALGANRLVNINNLIPQVIGLNLFLGMIIYAVTAPLAHWIFTFYNASDKVLDLSVSYYQIRAMGFPISLSTFAIFGVFRGLQNTSWAMIASLTGAVVNILLDYLLIYGLRGMLPSFGLMGAAYASIIAQLVMLLIAFYFLIKNTPFKLLIALQSIHPKLKKHIILTSNFFLRTVAINWAIFISYRYAAGYGENHGAAHAILMNIWLFFSFFIDGFANAGNAIGGKLLGSKDTVSLKYLGKTATFYGVAVAVVLLLICFMMYSIIGEIFTDDFIVRELFFEIFWIVLLMQPINAVAFVFDGIFKGLGEATYLRNLLIISTLVVFVPVLLIADGFGLELHAIWIAFTCWMVGRAIVLYFKFNRKLIEICV